MHDTTWPLPRPSHRAYGGAARLGDRRTKAPCPPRRHAARAGSRRAGRGRSSRKHRNLVRTKPARTLMTATFDKFFSEIAAAIGADAVNRSEETLRRYSENTMPGGDRRP